MAHATLFLARARCRFPHPAPRGAAHQFSELRSGASGGLANSLGGRQRMADQATMSDRRPARPKRDLLPDDGKEGALADLGDHHGVDLAAALEDAEDWKLAAARARVCLWERRQNSFRPSRQALRPVG
jgi:hypothetical protein